MAASNKHPQTFLVTGVTSGIGLAVCKSLAQQGHRLLMVGRRLQLTQNIAKQLKKETGNEELEVFAAELGSQESIRNLAKVVKRKTDRLDGIIYVAGTIVPRLEITSDGIERTFAVNYLSRFLLTHLLLDLLQRSAPSRVVSVAGAHYSRGRIHFEDLTLGKKYHYARANAQAKLADVLFTKAFARRYADLGISMNCLHPGAVRTGAVLRTSGISPFVRIMYRLFSPFFRSPGQGADTAVWLATADEAARFNGEYVVDRKPQKTIPLTEDVDLQDRLWKLSLELTRLEAFDYLPLHLGSPN